MRINRILLSTVLVVVALVVQICVFARLHLPGAVPDLLLLTVVGLALVYGHVGGCLIGFCAGLLADLAPPADHAAGRYALVLCVIGYAAGLARPENGRLRSATGPLVIVLAAAIGSTLMYAGVGSLVGDTAARHAGLGSLLLTAALYDVLLAPFTVPLIMTLARMTVNDPLAGDGASGTAMGEAALGWLSAGGSRPGRFGKASAMAGQRGGLLTKPAKSKAGRLKGVKRL